MTITQVAQSVQEVGPRLLRPRWLEDDTRDSVAMLGEEPLDRLDVVEGERCRQVPDRRRDTGVHRRRADEPVVDGEERLVAADRHHITPGRSSGKSDRRRGDIGAVLRELDHIAVADETKEALGRFDLEGARPNEVRPVLHRRGGRPYDPRFGMSESDGPQPRAIFDVLVPIDIPHVAAAPALDDRSQVLGVLVVPLRIGVGTAGHRVAEAPSKFVRSLRVPTLHPVPEVGWPSRRSAGRRRATRPG